MKSLRRMLALILSVIQLLAIAPVTAETADTAAPRVLFKFTGDEADDSEWAKQVNT